MIYESNKIPLKQHIYCTCRFYNFNMLDSSADPYGIYRNKENLYDRLNESQELIDSSNRLY